MWGLVHKNFWSSTLTGRRQYQDQISTGKCQEIQVVVPWNGRVSFLSLLYFMLSKNFLNAGF